MSEGSKFESLVVNFALANKYGLDEAIIIQFLIQMISQHKRMKRNWFEGRTWNYLSRRELAEQFSFWTEKEVRARLNRLIKRGILLKRNEGERSFNKQNFYAFANEEEFGFSSFETSIEKPKTLGDSNNSCVGPNGPTEKKSNNSYVGPNGPTDWPNRSTRSAQMGQSYTISNTISNQDIEKDIVYDKILSKTMPLSTPRKKDVVSPAKRWKLSAEEVIVFEWLKTQNINTEDKTLCFWAKNYSVDRLCEAIEYAKKTHKSNLGGLINYILSRNLMIPNPNAEENKRFAEQFVKQNQWRAASVMERYLKIKMPNGYDEELPYNISSEDFRERVERYYAIS